MDELMLMVVSTLCSSHLADLKSLTHDVLYETYRTEKLSRTVHTETQYVPLPFLPSAARR